MKKVTIETVLDVYDTVSELPSDIKDLMDKAQMAREKAYAPYSHFRVGAALQLKNGEVVIGNNQENAAFPSGLCAERVAVFQAGARFPGTPITAMAITARSLNHPLTTPTPPCGACRQALAEYEGNQEQSIPVYFMGERGKVVRARSIKDLLPLVFDKSYI